MRFDRGMRIGQTTNAQCWGTVSVRFLYGLGKTIRVISGWDQGK